MPTVLRKLRIRRISLVTAGANPDSTVELFKSADGAEAPVLDREEIAAEPYAWTCPQCQTNFTAPTQATVRCPGCGVLVRTPVKHERIADAVGKRAPEAFTPAWWATLRS